MTPESSEPSRTLVRPAVRWVAIVSTIILLPFAVHAAWDFVETRRLVRRIESIRTSGEGLAPADVGRGYRALTDDEARAARYYMAAAVLAYLPASKDREALGSVRAVVAGAADAAALPALRGRLEAVVRDGSEALALADRAAALPFRGFPPGTDYSYRTSEMWSLRDLNAMRVAWLSLSAEGDAAADAAVLDLEVRGLGGAFNMSGNDVATVLTFSRPSVEALGRLEAALAAAEAPDRALDTLLADRASFIDGTWREYFGPDPRVPWARTPPRTLDGWMSRPWVTRALVASLDQWQEATRAARTPWPERLQAVRAVAAKYPLRVRTIQGPRFRIRPATFPVAEQAASSVFASAGVLVADRSARIAVAIERYRRDHGDALPARLDQLVPVYLQALPLDPLTGQPLRFRPSGAAYVIYSVGEDGADDGGDLVSAFVRDTQRGWGRRPLRGKDMGIRVGLTLK